MYHPIEIIVLILNECKSALRESLPRENNIKKLHFRGDFFIVPLGRSRSYFIPGCNEIISSTARYDNSGSDSIGDYGIRPRKRYNL